jgi:DNA-binding LytR/AlgR family response regulator
MAATHSLDRARIPALAATAIVCATIALALQEFFSRDWGPGPVAYFTLFLSQAIGAGAWALLIPIAILPLVRRVPLSARGFLAHGVAGGALAAVQTLIAATLLATYFYGWSPLAIRDIFLDRFHTEYAWKVVTYLVIASTLALWLRPHGILADQAAPEANPAELKPVTGHLRRVLVRNEGRVTLVQADEIMWLEADDNNVVVHTAGAKHVVRGTLTHFADRMDPARFVRVHRSAIVNADCVREVQNWFAGDLVAILGDGTRVNVGRTYRDEFMARLEG